jgi:hypothetical protein
MAVRREANCARNRGLLAFLPAEARHRARSEWASGGRQGLSVLRFFGVAAVSDAQNKALAGETPLRGETPAVRAGRMPATQRTEWPSGGRQGLTVLRFFRVAAVSDAQNKALAGETPQRGETPAGRAGRPGGPLSGMPATQRTEWASGGREGLSVLRFFRVAAVSAARGGSVWDPQNKALAGETPLRGETPAVRAGRPGGPLSGMPATQRTEWPSGGRIRRDGRRAGVVEYLFRFLPETV